MSHSTFIRNSMLIREVRARKSNFSYITSLIFKTHTVTSVTRRNLLEGHLLKGNLLERNLLEGNLLERNLLERDLLERNLLARNPLKRNLLKRNLPKRNLLKRNIFTKKNFKRNITRSGIGDQPKSVQGRSPQRGPQNSMKVSQQIVKI